MTTNLYRTVEYPAELYSFIKVKDMSSMPETKMLMDVPARVKSIVDECVSSDDMRRGLFDFGFDIESVRRSQLLKVLPTELHDNEFQNSAYLADGFKDQSLGYMLYSITGGTCRNLLMDVSEKTDVDIVIGTSSDHSLAALQMCFKELPTDNRTIKLFQFGDNTMHTIPSPYVIFHYNGDGVACIDHVFIDPMKFDFTVNCACISSKDGWMYASPVTLLDTQQKVLRSTVQLSKDYKPDYLLRLPLLIRTIRFAVKYDMKVHNALYDAIKVYFRLEASRQGSDDISMYHCLKHICNDPPAAKEEFWRILKKVGAYETDRFEKFEDYFNYISQAKTTLDRRSKIYGGYYNPTAY